MPNNASRRRQERDRARNKATVLVGQGIVAAPLGVGYAPPKQMRQLPAKVEGAHRWVAIASFVVDEWPENMLADENMTKVLGPRNMYDLGVVCIDCERPYGTVDGQACPAPDWEKT